MKRYEPADSENGGLGVHSAGLPFSLLNTQLTSTLAECYMQVAETAGVKFVILALQMGVDIRLASLAASVPQEQMHVLSRAEMRDLRVVTHDAAGNALTGVAVAAAQ